MRSDEKVDQKSKIKLRRNLIKQRIKRDAPIINQCKRFDGITRRIIVLTDILGDLCDFGNGGRLEELGHREKDADLAGGADQVRGCDRVTAELYEGVCTPMEWPGRSRTWLRSYGGGVRVVWWAAA
jgi:hypothetical protein